MSDPILLFLNLGGGEVFIIVLVIIMFFGSDKLPGLAKGIGKGIREINDAKAQIQNEIQRSTNGFTEEIKKHTSDIQSEIDKANISVKRQVSDVNKAVTDEGKAIDDTLK
ncbi:MAG: twin-arginine translocase TatA/TatE family subunit [Bacteroidota bacterium]|nr:twin-arginine translocase TatA/TatE family subunit [Bacteroidota bacterium]